MPHSKNLSADDDTTDRDSSGDFDAQQMLAAAGHATQESEFFKSEPPGYVKGRHKYVGIIGTVIRAEEDRLIIKTGGETKVTIVRGNVARKVVSYAPDAAGTYSPAGWL